MPNIIFSYRKSTWKNSAGTLFGFADRFLSFILSGNHGMSNTLHCIEYSKYNVIFVIIKFAERIRLSYSSMRIR